MRRVPFKNYDVHWCLAAAKRHGVGVLVKKGLKTPIRVSRTLDVDDAVDETPDDIDTNEGRVLALEYENMVVVNTYVSSQREYARASRKTRAVGSSRAPVSLASRRTKRRRLDG